MMSIRIEFEIGHEAAVRTKSTPEGFTHDWEIFVRGIGSNNIQHYVEKVVFNLHETFPKPRRAIKEPPYKVKESGYAGFNFPIDIYLKNNGEPKKITFNYDLNLQQTGPPIHNEVKKHFVFSNVTDEFRHRLIKGGGTVVSVNSNTNEFSRDTASDNRSQLISKPKLGGDLLKKHKARLDEPKSNSFADLFGTPITKTTKVSPDQKSQIRTSPNVTTSKPEKSSSSEKSKSKHSPHKDKDREKSGKDREHDKKSKDEKRNKDKNKERDRSKDKSSKQRDKSPKRRSPSPKRSPKREPPSPLPPPPPPPPKPKVEEKLKQHYDQGKEKSKTNDIKLEKKAKKDKKDKERDKERKEHKSHKDSSGSKSGESETKEIKDKGTKESIKHNKENKEKEHVKNNEKPKLLETPNKENHHDVKIEKDKEKSKLDKTENIEKRHKHKKKDKEKNKKDKEDKERNKEKEKKAEKSNNSQQKIVKEENTKSVQEEASFIKSTNNQEAELSSVKEKPMLISELSDDEHSDNSNGSLNNSDIESVNKNNNSPVKAELKPPEPPEPIIEKVKKPEIEVKPEKVKKSKKHKDKNKSEKNAEKDISEKKRKRKSGNKNKEELPEPDIDKIEEEPPTKILKESEEQRTEEMPVERSMASAEYMNILKDLQHKIMTLQDNSELQRVVQMIAETGQYEITRQTFDFDLCALDRTTVRRLQDFFAMT